LVAKGLYFDTATMYYRAFFAVPESVKAPDGTPSGAVRGFLDMAATFVKDNPAEQIVFAWDTDWRPQWRVDLIDTYKTHRLDESSGESGFEEIPDTLSPQISAIAEILDAIGVCRYGQNSHEADDILGALINNAQRNCIVVTGDRDLFQLVNDKRKNRVISMNKGMKNLETVTDEYLVDRYGVTGSQYVDFAVLRGDPSDGLPGIKGIGEVTASNLIKEFKSIDKLILAAKKKDTRIKPGAIANLLAGEEYLVRASKVVTVRQDAKIPKNIDKPTRIKNTKYLKDLAQDWGVSKQVSRLLTALKLPEIG
jgi:5'-3' exonuclease